MSDRETRDFMSVDTFSQLPFIRREKPPNLPVRLFGFDFPSEPVAATTAASGVNKSGSTSAADRTPAAAASSGEISRKFECHYCCRNFPTSQALGGHQNAHKRERQHAKRAHLQSAMEASGGGSGVISEPHFYGLLGYHRHGMSATPESRFPFNQPSQYYPPWSLPLGGRLYSGLGSTAQPINGSPLPELWRVPSKHHQQQELSAAAATAPPLALFRGEVRKQVPAGGGGGSSSSSSYSISPREQRVHELKAGVSLDLHL